METIELNPTSTSNIEIKKLEINEGNNKYECQIQIINNFLQVSLFSENLLKHQGNIHLSKIQTQIYALADYSIKEVFEEINSLDKENFSIVLENNKYQLKIEFIILRRKKYIYVDLNEKMNLQENDLIKTISELKETIKNKDDNIKLLEKELNKYKSISFNENSYDNFNIKLKEPIHKLNYHKKEVYCSTILNDGRIVTGSGDCSIIIYDKETFKPDITIKEKSDIYCIIQLNSGELVSGLAGDGKINIYNIGKNKYEIKQSLTYHNRYINKIIELKNNKLVSCSGDSSIFFYFKDNGEFKKDFSIKTNGSNSGVVQTKNNEISYSEEKNNAICFF